MQADIIDTIPSSESLAFWEELIIYLSLLPESSELNFEFIDAGMITPEITVYVISRAQAETYVMAVDHVPSASPGRVSAVTEEKTLHRMYETANNLAIVT